MKTSLKTDNHVSNTKLVLSSYFPNYDTHTFLLSIMPIDLKLSNILLLRNVSFVKQTYRTTDSIMIQYNFMIFIIMSGIFIISITKCLEN